MAAGLTADQLLDAVMKEFLPKLDIGMLYGKKLDQAQAGKAILAQDRETQANIVRAALDRLAALESQITEIREQPGNRHNPHFDRRWPKVWGPRWVLLETLRGVLRRTLPLDEDTVVRLLQWPVQASNGISTHVYPVAGMASAAENFAEAHGVSERLREAIGGVLVLLKEYHGEPECRKMANRLESVVAGGPGIKIELGEAWSD